VAKYDSADLLALSRQECRQPTTSDYPLDADVYEMLSRGQEDVIFRLGVTVPDSQYGAPTLLVSADGGYTFPFGTDSDTNAIFPIGHVEIYRTLDAIPNGPCSPVADFMFEGNLIRVPNNMTWSGPGPYARFITPPLKITASVQPVVKPVQAREALIYYAAAKIWRLLGNQENAAASMQDYERCFARNQLALRTQFAAMEAAAGLSAPQRSWANDIGQNGSGPAGTAYIYSTGP